MALRINSEAPNFTRRHHPGQDQLPRVDRQRLGDPVLAPQGLHAGVHHRARLHGRPEAGVRQAQLQDHRPQRRPGGRPQRWAKDIEETQGHAVTYPMIGDPELKVAKAYDMLPEESGTTSQGRTAADNATVRSVFVIGPDKKIKAMLTYPMTHRPQLRRGAAAPGLLPAHGQAQGRDAGELEAGRGRHHRPARSPTRTPRRSIPRAGSRRSRTCASSRSRSRTAPAEAAVAPVAGLEATGAICRAKRLGRVH